MPTRRVGNILVEIDGKMRNSVKNGLSKADEPLADDLDGECKTRYNVL